MKVPLELFTSLMKIWGVVSDRKNVRGNERDDKDLSDLLPDLRMLSAEDLGVKVTVSLCGDGLDVGLSTDFDMLVVLKEDVLWNEGIVEGVEVKSGILRMVVRCGERRGCGHRVAQLVGGSGETGGSTDQVIT